MKDTSDRNKEKEKGSQMPNNPKVVADVAVRLAVVETKIENIETYLAEHKTILNNLDVNVDEIRERMNRQSGELPSMANSLRSLSADYAKINEKIGSHDSIIEVNKMYNKIIWSIFGIMGTGVIGLLIEYFKK